MDKLFALLLLLFSATLPMNGDVTYSFAAAIPTQTVDSFGNPISFPGSSASATYTTSGFIDHPLATFANCAPLACTAAFQPAFGSSDALVVSFSSTTPAMSFPFRFPAGALSHAGTYSDTTGTATLTVTGFAGTSILPGSGTPLGFMPLTPCRILDTRSAGESPIAAGATRTLGMRLSPCGIPGNAAAYSLNITVIPQGPLRYLTAWPTGQAIPYVSTLNSFDGRVKANAAIVPAGADGAVNLYASDAVNVIVDINGYFVAAPGNASLAFYPVTPCRVADTRNAPGLLGGPALAAGQTRAFAVLSSACGVPPSAQSYSLNITAIPTGPLGFVTIWPFDQPQPVVSTLNAPTGTITANAAIVSPGTAGVINLFASNPTDIIIDVNGYFAPPGGPGALSFYTTTPCRVSDTRGPAGLFGGGTLAAGETRSYNPGLSDCATPPTAKAYSLNATALPIQPLGFLTLWPADRMRPLVSTLNSLDGSVVSNAAIVPASAGGAINVYASNVTDLILDLNGYFAP